MGLKMNNARKRAGFRLFLLVLPFLAAIFVFNYMPLYGWIYAFFDYKAGVPLARELYRIEMVYHAV
jgi:ABC-type polysaccharide transport system permease subunit